MCVFWNFPDLSSDCLRYVKRIRIYSGSIDSVCPEYIELCSAYVDGILTPLQDLSICTSQFEYADWDKMFLKLWNLRIVSAEREGVKEAIKSFKGTRTYVKGEYVCTPSKNEEFAFNLIDIMFNNRKRKIVTFHVNTDTIYIEADAKKFFRFRQRLKL